jgi:hypothetical protein
LNKTLVTGRRRGPVNLIAYRITGKREPETALVFVIIFNKKLSSNPMKNFLLLFLSLFILQAKAQEKGTYQADSIYKANHVKLRKWYSGTNKSLGVITYYDREGRLIKYQVNLNLGATVNTTHYTYDSIGNLISIVDSTKNGLPDKKEVKRVKKMGINPNFILNSIKNKPAIEVSEYELIYENHELSRITKYNPDGSLDYIDKFKDNGMIQEREWYRDGKLYRVDTTEFLIPNFKNKYYGWEIRGDTKSEWNYTYDYKMENGLVKEYTRFDDGELEDTVKYFYDTNGLLLKTEGYILEQFEYEYYQ